MNKTESHKETNKHRVVGVSTIFLAGILLLGTVTPSMVFAQQANVNRPTPVSGIPENAKAGDPIPGAFIVVLNDGFSPKDVAFSKGVSPQHVYSNALNGFSVRGIAQQTAEQLEKDPRVKFVEQDTVVKTLSQTLPTGIDRVEADNNSVASIDGSQTAVDVDIAIIDTGVDLDHPDINVHKSTDCTAGGPMNNKCNDGKGDDGNGHGSHVAGISAAIDDNSGVVGMAPGARIWAVKVLGDDGSGWMSDVVAGVDWVTSHSGKIEVSNMSLGGQGQSDSLRTAIQNSVDKGVFYAVAAGNDATDVYGDDATFGNDDDIIPAAYPEVATISAMADSDGAPGGQGSDTSYGSDDSFASFSNFAENVVSNNPVSSPGAAIDLLMPGVEIFSTWKDGEYKTASGTSMSSPHGAGLAALYIVNNGLSPSSASDVNSIRQALIDDGVAQDSDNGLVTLNDPDNNLENIGWAQDSIGNPPSVSWVNPTDGETVSSSVNIKIDASDTEDADDTLTVEWNVDDGTWHTATYDSDCSCYTDTWDSTTVSDGDHNLDARATDSDSNESISTITVSTENTDDPPTVAWVNPRDDDTVSDTVTIQIDASDSEDADDTLTVEWQINEGAWKTAAFNSDTGYYEDDWDTTSVSDGGYDLDARATDSASNTSAEKRVTVTVDNTSSGSSDDMYVWEMTFSQKDYGPGGSFHDIMTTVTIHSDSDTDGTAESTDDPVSDASTKFVLTHDTDEDGVFEPGTDDDSWDFSGSTDSNGQITFTLKHAPTGEYQGEVTGLTHSTYTWNNSLDADNPDTYTLK